MERRLDPTPPILDADTAERMLAGAVADADAPPGYAAVARLLEAATSPTRPGELAGEAEAVASFAAALTPTRRFPVLAHLKFKLAVATLAGGLTLSGSLAAAGALPGTVQAGASAVLDTVGINVPNSDAAVTTEVKLGAEVEVVDHDADEEGTTEPTTPKAPKPAKDANHGDDVSDAAHKPAPANANHGSEVCRVASEGRCQPDHDAETTPASAPAAQPETKSYADQIAHCDEQGSEKVARFTADGKTDQAEKSTDQAKDCREKFEDKQAGAADPADAPKPEGHDGDDEHGNDPATNGASNGKASANHGEGHDADHGKDGLDH